jgi:hypothetical protein
LWERKGGQDASCPYDVLCGEGIVRDTLGARISVLPSGQRMSKILFLIVLYSVILVFLWGVSRFLRIMENLGRHMIDNGFVIKKGYLSRNHPNHPLFGKRHRYYYEMGLVGSDYPAKDHSVGKLYSYLYYYNAVACKWFIWGMTILAVLLFCAQIISVLTTGRYFRDNFLFAKMLAL